MSKIVPAHDVGIPVPAADPTRNWDPANPGSMHLIVYYGPAGFTPSYAQPARIDTGLVSALTTKTVNGVLVYDDPIGAQFPAGLTSGSYDLYFTLEDANGNEGDFSPKLDVSLDVIIPPTLGQPVEL